MDSSTNQISSDSESDNLNDPKFVIFSQVSKLFQFRCSMTVNKGRMKRSNYVKKGQYQFPFTFTLPDTLPSSFRYTDNNGHVFGIKYTVSVYFKSKVLECTTEFKVL